MCHKWQNINGIEFVYRQRHSLIWYRFGCPETPLLHRVHHTDTVIKSIDAQRVGSVGVWTAYS